MSRRSHYLWSDAWLVLPFVALVVNVAAIAFCIMTLHAMQQRLQLEFAGPGIPPGLAESKVPVVIVRVEPGPTLIVDKQRIATMNDLEFKLSGKSSVGARVLLQVAPSLPADVMTETLALCARAGFRRVAIQTISSAD